MRLGMCFRTSLNSSFSKKLWVYDYIWVYIYIYIYECIWVYIYIYRYIYSLLVTWCMKIWSHAFSFISIWVWGFFEWKRKCSVLKRAHIKISWYPDVNEYKASLIYIYIYIRIYIYIVFFKKGFYIRNVENMFVVTFSSN